MNNNEPRTHWSRPEIQDIASQQIIKQGYGCSILGLIFMGIVLAWGIMTRLTEYKHAIENLQLRMELLEKENKK